MGRKLGMVALVVVGLVAAGCQVNPGDPGPADVTFDIVANGTGAPAISPLIYGTNDASALSSNRQTAVRLGGNRWTAYNWENNASNAGSDYCFQNDGFLSSSNVPGAAVKATVDQATAAGAAAVLTVPIGDYVSADENGGCDVRNSGPDYLQTRFRRNIAVKGSAFTLTPDVNDSSVYEDEYVNWLKATEPSANVVFDLDNEPDLWSTTHAEVHPNAVTYAELASRSATYAAAIKNAWPAAKVAGPLSYGFYGYERLQGAPDAANRNFLDWWLDQMKAAGIAAGKRLIDYMDLHWYPEATGGGVRITGSDTSPAVVAAREQAPRSLWDPS
ncbi:MAG: glycoside hydrolase family 44 protein, partial [Actinomycetota bacterium]|nr:glycoside hydrolase family 44 protein [Actinomycetota bacterium]